MFKRGTVVQHADEKWIGVFLEDEQRVFVLEGEPTENPINLTRLVEIGGYEFEAAITIGDRAKALEMYRRATTAIHAAQVSAAPDRFYVYRQDPWEPGGLEYWKPFETVDEAKAEIEMGAFDQDMRIYRARNNELTPILSYDGKWDVDIEKRAHHWNSVDNEAKP